MFGIILNIVLCFSVTGAVKILIIYPIPSLSHHRPVMALTENLVRRGHEVFLISPLQISSLEQHGNYTFVDVAVPDETFSDNRQNDTVNFQRPRSAWQMLEIFAQLAELPRKQFLTDSFLNFKKKVHSEKLKFDVAIIESLLIPSSCAMIRLLGGAIPIISLSSFPAEPTGTENYMGSFSHPSFIPYIRGEYTDRMNLWEKIYNWILSRYFASVQQSLLENAARRFFKETFGPEKESLVDGCWTNISLILMATNSMYFYPRPLGPNVIEVGPLHMRPPGALPKALQNWLEGADKGVIYFNLGCNFKSTSLTEDARNNILKYFKELPQGYRVLWKWEADGPMPGLGDNILTQKWFPQQSILGHPNVKVFITQGGLQSFQEAVHHAVPMVGIPLFSDQRCNVAKIVDAKIGIRLPPEELHSFEKIKSAIDKVLYDKNYEENIKKHSAIARDFTSQSMDKAMFWVEHVARHAGASHLRPATAEANIFQFLCLDIISVILGLISILSFSIYVLCKYLVSIVFVRVSLKTKEH
nr:PREDICTED: UDP-glucuronosyltransferase 2B18-like [Bemisia tabaci]